MIVVFQDMDRYEKGTSLIGEGPAAPAPSFPIMPPSVGYVSFEIFYAVVFHQKLRPLHICAVGSDSFT
jgi:hypothetical protein